MASSTSRPSAMIRAPREILCKSMSSRRMHRKVTASTSGMVSATTRPGRTSMRSGLVCRPSATKLTASTMRMASIRVCTNSPTEADTASGWFDTRCSSMPTGNSLFMRVTVVCRALPMSMMLPPFSIDTPRPITSLPLKRILSFGGSVNSRFTVAKSPRRKVVPLARSSRFSRSLTVAMAPVTRTCRLSVGVTSTPVALMLFCSDSCCTMASNGMPSWANFLWEKMILIFSSCTPNSSTFDTCPTASSSWRTLSA